MVEKKELVLGRFNFGDLKTKENEVKMNLSKLRVNEEKVSMEDLNGRFRPAYDKLRKELVEEGIDLILKAALDKKIVVMDDKDLVISLVTGQSYKENLDNKVQKALLCDKDYDAFWKILEMFYVSFQERYEVYVNTKNCVEKQGRIYNPLLGMYWDAETQTWGINANGVISFCGFGYIEADEAVKRLSVLKKESERKGNVA